MKTFTLALIACTRLSATEITVALQEPTILAESWDALWHQRLDEAHQLNNNGQLVKAAEAYKNLADNKQHRNETVSSIAEKEYQKLLESNGYVEQKYQEIQKNNQEAQQLWTQLQQAQSLKSQGDYAGAKTIFKRLAHPPASHYWMEGFARNELQTMLDAGLIDS